MGGNWEEKILDKKLDKEHRQRQGKLVVWGIFGRQRTIASKLTPSVYLERLLGDKHPD
jgi:hypothetical protein